MTVMSIKAVVPRPGIGELTARATEIRTFVRKQAEQTEANRQVSAEAIERMRAADYHHIELISTEAVVLNSKCALYRMTGSRQRPDGSEIARPTFTEVVSQGPAGWRISMIVLHV